MASDSDKLQKWPPRVWTARIWLEVGGIALALIAIVTLATRFLPQGMDWKGLNVKAELEVKGMKYPVRWACHQQTNEDGSLTLRPNLRSS